ncbi:chemotaxis protein CheX [Helicovermis profundi]|uniref:Chemotaxis protein CheX n=1 Tax=Helicovermis profundi TaxID=3065157 RepID=A0AAU9EN54_9FIRM|nr:chemotaxis protein CheX [Clostridia bacterium S502]
MKVEYINPFIKATTSVLKQIANIDFNMGKPYIKTSPYETKNLIILVGITGEMRGQAAISMDLNLAKKIASSMMMGMPVDELDELSKSAISELGNMIMGNTATLLFNTGVSIDITPPTLMIGESVSMSSGSMQTVGVPLTSEIGDISLDISIKD